MTARTKTPPRRRRASRKAPQHCLRTITELADSLHDLSRRAVEVYTPVVDAILRSRSPDTRHIENTLDGLLGFCGYPDALLLYKKLCRHYYTIDPTATASYVHAYREMWDSEKEDKP